MCFDFIKVNINLVIFALDMHKGLCCKVFDEF